MTSHTHHDLDLTGKLRPGLDLLANEIVIALKKRTRFPVNHPIYEPGLVLGQPEDTLLDFSLHAVERLHAALGRYTFATQEAFTDIGEVGLAIDRAPPQSPVLATRTGVGKRIIAFYRSWLERACPAGVDSSSFGESVTSDVVALHAIMERINLGKPVAEVKFRSHEKVLRASAGDRDSMLACIRHPDREARVLAMAASLAERYDIEVDGVRQFFAFMIDMTVDVEIDYLRERLAL